MSVLGGWRLNWVSRCILPSPSLPHSKQDLHATCRHDRSASGTERKEKRMSLFLFLVIPLYFAPAIDPIVVPCDLSRGASACLPACLPGFWWAFGGLVSAHRVQGGRCVIRPVRGDKGRQQQQTTVLDTLTVEVNGFYLLVGSNQINCPQPATLA